MRQIILSNTCSISFAWAQESKSVSVFFGKCCTEPRIILLQKAWCHSTLCWLFVPQWSSHEGEYQKSHFYQSVDLQHIHGFTAARYLIGNQNIYIKNPVIIHLYICTMSYCFDYIGALYFCFSNDFTHTLNIPGRGWKGNKCLTTAWIVLRFQRIKCTCQPHQNPLTKLVVDWLWFPNTGGWFIRGILLCVWVFSKILY